MVKELEFILAVSIKNPVLQLLFLRILKVKQSPQPPRKPSILSISPQTHLPVVLPQSPQPRHLPKLHHLVVINLVPVITIVLPVQYAKIQLTPMLQPVNSASTPVVLVNLIVSVQLPNLLASV